MPALSRGRPAVLLLCAVGARPLVLPARRAPRAGDKGLK